MSKYYRVYSDTFNGHVFTEQAYNILKNQLGNGDPNFHDFKVISSVEIEPHEKIHDVEDLESLGYSAFTEQSDEELFTDDSLFDGFNESDDY